VSQTSSRFFRRRIKEAMGDWEGPPLFKECHAMTVGYDSTPEETRLYDEVARYVCSKRKEAKAKSECGIDRMTWEYRSTSHSSWVTVR
jgi:hypothetical protein